MRVAEVGSSLLSSTCSGARLPIPTVVSPRHASLIDCIVSVWEGRVLDPPAALPSPGTPDGHPTEGADAQPACRPQHSCPT